MSRSRGFMQQFSMQLSILEHAFVKFYADNYSKSERDIIRTMVSRYVNADKGFDPVAFNKFVKKKMMEHHEDDPDAQAELKRVAEDYVGARKKSGKTMSRG